MKQVVLYLGILVLVTFSKTYGQVTFEQKAKGIASQIEKITKEEKASLKQQVEMVNDELEKGTIDRNQADEKKLKLAEETASKIETRVAVEEQKLTQLVKEKVEGRIATLDTNNVKMKEFLIGLKVKKDTAKTHEKRTTSQFVFAAGVNNLVTNKAVAHSDFRYWGSHFYELGWSYNTRILKNNNVLHFKYGWSVQ